LRQDDRALGGANLIQKCRGMRPKFSDWANILGRTETGRAIVRHDVHSPVHVNRLFLILLPQL
jgi:hypothetical protein